MSCVSSERSCDGHLGAAAFISGAEDDVNFHRYLRAGLGEGEVGEELARIGRAVGGDDDGVVVFQAGVAAELVAEEQGLVRDDEDGAGVGGLFVFEEPSDAGCFPGMFFGGNRFWPNNEFLANPWGFRQRFYGGRLWRRLRADAPSRA